MGPIIAHLREFFWLITFKAYLLLLLIFYSSWSLHISIYCLLALLCLKWFVWLSVYLSVISTSVCLSVCLSICLYDRQQQSTKRVQTWCTDWVVNCVVMSSRSESDVEAAPQQQSARHLMSQRCCFPSCCSCSSDRVSPSNTVWAEDADSDEALEAADEVLESWMEADSSEEEVKQESSKSGFSKLRVKLIAKQKREWSQRGRHTSKGN